MLMPIIGGVFGLVGIVMFIAALRTSYAIERNVRPRPAGAMPAYTNIVASALAIGVAADDHATRILVKRLRMQLLGALAAIAMGGAVSATFGLG